MRTIGAVIFPGFELLDIFGPLQMFGLLPEEFAITMVAEGTEPVTSNGGPRVLGDVTFGEAGDFDLILVPGGRGTRREVDNPAILEWLTERAPAAELILTVCTGSAVLARTGLLDRKRATTNKMAFAWVASQGPDVEWVKHARWVEDGRFFTSSGVSAGTDMSLAAIARLLGMETAEQVAVWAEYHWHRDPGDDPFAAIHGLV